MAAASDDALGAAEAAESHAPAAAGKEESDSEAPRSTSWRNVEGIESLSAHELELFKRFEFGELQAKVYLGVRSARNMSAGVDEEQRAIPSSRIDHYVNKVGGYHQILICTLNAPNASP